MNVGEVSSSDTKGLASRRHLPWCFGAQEKYRRRERRTENYFCLVLVGGGKIFFWKCSSDTRRKV